jgi:tetratricopeptide (TPR) repeat protein
MSNRSLSELEKAVGANPESPALRHLLGAHYAQVGRYEEAERELYRAISLDPQAHIARMQLGLLYLTSGDPHRAISTWQQLESLDDANALKSFKRGLEALIRDDFAGCTRWLNQGIAQNQANPALNGDMRQMLARVAAHLAAHKEPGVPESVRVERQPGGEVSSGKEPESLVRTDFSLYGTRH